MKATQSVKKTHTIRPKATAAPGSNCSRPRRTSSPALLALLSGLQLLGSGPGARAADYPSSATGTYTITTSGNDVIYTFKGSGSFTPSAALTVNILLVGGGGGGGGTLGNAYYRGGGGGAGGVVTLNGIVLTPSTPYTVTVSDGGAAGTSTNVGGNGTSTSFGTYAAAGGGGGGSGTDTSGAAAGQNGASGGGGAHYSSNGYAFDGSGGTGSEGHDGAAAGSGYGGGGGGGSGGDPTTWTGGAGTASSLSGSAVVYGAGGAGATGAADGAPANANTGNGGNGGGSGTVDGSTHTGGLGGSGVLIVRYTLPNYTITASAGANGSISPAGTTTLYYGSSQAYTITPNPGCLVNDVVVDGSSLGPVSSYTFTTVTGNHTISAAFVLISSATGTYGVSRVGNNVIYTFTAGSGTFTPAVGMTANLLLVGGGGGGGGVVANSSGFNAGGGGGAGGFVSQNSVALTANNAYAVTVGIGGTAGTSTSAGCNGSNSVFDSFIAYGGGGGGSGYDSATGVNGSGGGSGGGGARYSGGARAGSGGACTNGQGNAGADQGSGRGGGGGGASAAGSGQNGGNGTASSITGTSVTYAGGGGACIASGYGAAGSGGTGGGGAGALVSSGHFANGIGGAANTGGGGGGAAVYGSASSASGGAGGSGVVIVSYTFKTTPTVTAWPTASAITYGQALSGSTLSGGSASVGGSFAFTSPATVPSAGSYSASVTFTPTDTSAFNPVTGSINLTVSPASTTTSVATSKTPALPSDSITFTATVGPGGPVPTGTVQFKSNGTNLNAAVALNGGQAQTSVTGSSLGHGSFTIAAVYANSDGNFAGSTGSLNTAQVVNEPPAASNPSVSRGPGMSLKIPISALGTDPDTDALCVTELGGGTQGASITCNSVWVFYLPQSGNSDGDSFMYRISDGFGGTVSGTVTVSVVRQGGAAQQITCDHGAVTVNFAGIPNYYYEVQRSADAGFGSYDVMTVTQAPGAGVFTYTDSSPLNPSGYYRLMQH